MVNVLVVGGSGFIFSQVIRYLHDRYSDMKIINYDAQTYSGRGNNLIDLKGSDRYIEYCGPSFDARNFDVLDNIFMKHSPDIVLSAFGETHVDNSIDGPDIFYQTNVMGTYNVIKACTKHNVSKIIHMSTDEVYSALKEGEIRTFKETDDYNPSSPYAISKALGDLMVRSYINHSNFPAIIVRSCNVYGPYQYPEKLISLNTTNLLENKKIKIYGRGMQQREWIYISDFCNAFDTILNKGTIGEIYNIATGTVLKNSIVANMICELMHVENGIEYIKDPRGNVHDFAYMSNASKLIKLGWSPKVSFKDGLLMTINWYCDNFQWWGKLKK